VKIDIPKVMTTIECGKCGGKQMVTAIYKEVKEKEKPTAV
jgi:predicted metal-binding protein